MTAQMQMNINILRKKRKQIKRIDNYKKIKQEKTDIRPISFNNNLSKDSDSSVMIEVLHSNPTMKEKIN
jgi:hypothetical protein